MMIEAWKDPREDFGNGDKGDKRRFENTWDKAKRGLKRKFGEIVEID